MMASYQLYSNQTKEEAEKKARKLLANDKKLRAKGGSGNYSNVEVIKTFEGPGRSSNRYGVFVTNANLGKIRNPGESIDAISKGFHGRPVAERFEVQEQELYNDNFAVLGCLVELCITRDDGKTGITVKGFKTPQDPKYKKGDEVYVAAPDRHNIEFVGGDQKILNAEKMAHVSDKNLINIGKVESIVYLSDKHHLVGSNGTEEEYDHSFGRKRFFVFGKRIGRPDLIYDCMNQQMKLVGGTYTITDEGIKD